MTLSEENRDKIVHLDAQVSEIKCSIKKIESKLEKIHTGLFVESEDGKPCLAAKINIVFQKEQARRKLAEHSVTVVVTTIIISIVGAVLALVGFHK